MTEHTFALADLQAAMQKVVDGGHSVFSPSGSKGWLGCSGSLIPNIFAKDDSGIEAAYGTVGHWVGETWLKAGRKPRHLLGMVKAVETDSDFFAITIDEDMMDHVQRYVDWCEFLPGQHFVETKVYFSQLTPIPKQGGTADHVACTYQKMVITDLKLGKGVLVVAKDNTQAQLYALGFFYEWDWLYDFQEIEIRIAQPRMGNFDTWTITRADLLEFAEYAKERAFAAWKPNAPRSPSIEACQWCRVKSTCAANAKVVFDMTGGAFDDIGGEIDVEDIADFKRSIDREDQPVIANVATMDTAMMEKLYAHRGQVERFWKELAIELARRAIVVGEKIYRWKIVEGRSRRAFKSNRVAASRLVDLGCDAKEVVKEVTCSPAEAERLLRKAGHRPKDMAGLLDDLVTRRPGPPTLAPITDKRPALGDMSEGAFDDLIREPEQIDEEI